jgi:hypothetical protein
MNRQRHCKERLGINHRFNVVYTLLPAGAVYLAGF